MEYKYEGHSLKAGIYKLTNKLNGRIYIGSAKEFKSRWGQHASSLRNQKHSNRFLQADYNKCGEEAFVFEVVEVTGDKSKQERLLIEEGYIKQYYDSGDRYYNLCSRAISREGFKSKDPEETKRKMSEAQKRRYAEKPELREHLSKVITIAYSNPETIRRKSESSKAMWQNPTYIEKQKSVKFGGWNKGMKMPKQSGENHPLYGKHLSKETILKLKESLKGRIPWNKGTKKPKPIKEKKFRGKIYENIQLISPDGTVYTRIEGLTVFANQHGLKMKSLWKLLAGQTPSTKGWKLASTITKND